MRVRIRFGVKIQFALLTLFLICATAGVSGYFTLKRERQILEDQIVGKGKAVALGLAANCAEALLPKPDDLYLATLIKETLADKTIGYALLVDEKGKIVAHSDLSLWGKDYVAPVKRVRNPVDRSYIDISVSKEGQPFYDFSAPILVARTSKLGTVHIGVPVQLVDDLVRSSRNRLAMVALALLGVGITVSVVMVGLIMRPIQKLATGAEKIGDGDLEYRIRMSRSDEFGLLASSFNSMASKLSEMYLNTLQMLANALEAKDVYSRGHTERVTRYAVEIAKKMNLPEPEVEIIRKASMIHDIGKIGIRESILNKTGTLTEEEYDHIKTHTTWGAHILKPITSLAAVTSCLYHHHERYDGTGYPSGMCSADIPLGARIIAVADTFDAMTTDRPYRKAMSIDEAIDELRSCSGTQFDPQVVRTFIKIAKKIRSLREASIEEELMASIR